MHTRPMSGPHYDDQITAIPLQAHHVRLLQRKHTRLVGLSYLHMHLRPLHQYRYLEFHNRHLRDIETAHLEVQNEIAGQEVVL